MFSQALNCLDFFLVVSVSLDCTVVVCFIECKIRGLDGMLFVRAALETLAIIIDGWERGWELFGRNTIRVFAFKNWDRELS